MNETLIARVKAQNTANKFAHEFFTAMKTALAPFVGQTVLKKEGGILAKVEKAFPPLPNSTWLRVYRYASDYSLVWIVNANEVQNGHAHYAEVSVYVGNLKNGVLESLYPSFEAKTDYKAEEVEAKREAYRKAKQASDAAFSALHPFGEYDR